MLQIIKELGNMKGHSFILYVLLQELSKRDGAW